MTAVQWLFEQFFKVKWEDMPSKPIIFEQAFELDGNAIQLAEQYYNETYKPEAKL